MFNVKNLVPYPVFTQLVENYLYDCNAFVFILLIMLIFMYQPIYGFTSNDPLRFKRAAGHKDLFYIDDKDVEFKDVRNY